MCGYNIRRCRPTIITLIKTKVAAYIQAKIGASDFKLSPRGKKGGSKPNASKNRLSAICLRTVVDAVGTKIRKTLTEGQCIYIFPISHHRTHNYITAVRISLTTSSTDMFVLSITKLFLTGADVLTSSFLSSRYSDIFATSVSFLYSCLDSPCTRSRST